MKYKVTYTQTVYETHIAYVETDDIESEDLTVLDYNLVDEDTGDSNFDYDEV